MYLCPAVVYLCPAVLYLCPAVVYLCPAVVYLCPAVVYLCPAVHSAWCKVRPPCSRSHRVGLSRGALQDCRVGQPAPVMALVEGEEGRLTPDSLAALLSRPWLINRVTCGTIVTWSKVDTATHDNIVSLDVCLLGLITANIFLFGPLLLSRAAGLSSPGLGAMMGSLQKRYDTLLVPLQERYDNLLVPPPLDRQTSNTTFFEAAAQQIL